MGSLRRFFENDFERTIIIHCITIIIKKKPVILNLNQRSYRVAEMKV